MGWAVRVSEMDIRKETISNPNRRRFALSVTKNLLQTQGKDSNVVFSVLGLVDPCIGEPDPAVDPTYGSVLVIGLLRGIILLGLFFKQIVDTWLWINVDVFYQGETYSLFIIFIFMYILFKQN